MISTLLVVPTSTAAAPRPSTADAPAAFTVHLAAHFGLCFGVRDAIAQAEALAAAGPLTVLGELAHNLLVRARLKAAGIVEGDLSAVGSAATARVLITAHGAAQAAQAAWRRAGHTVIDGACPLVRHAHRELARLVAAGCHPVIVGRPGHAEVAGLCGDHPGAAVVDCVADLAHVPEHPRYGVVSQTTQPIAKVRGMVAELRRLRSRSEVVFRDTVCQPTKDRQRALVDLIAACEVVVVVGGHGSNNTRELVAACARGGRRAHHVEDAAEIDPAWFYGVAHVGLTAGTSTLPETVAEVMARLQAIAVASSGEATATIAAGSGTTFVAMRTVAEVVADAAASVATPPPAPAAPGGNVAVADVRASQLPVTILPPLPSRANLAALPPRAASPFAAWRRHFEHNRLDRPEPAWDRAIVGAPAIVALMARSLAHLQLGESGDGAVLLSGAARVYGDDPDYGAALALFIGEEQEHARLLALAVRRLGGELVQRHWTHASFRAFRHALGVRFELQILLTAEIVGTAFYRLLHRHGPDPVVGEVCALLLADEEHHLAFHRERLRLDQARWSAWRRHAWRGQFRTLLLGAALVAWCDFAPTLTAFGARRRDFLAGNRAEAARAVDA